MRSGIGVKTIRANKPRRQSPNVSKDGRQWRVVVINFRTINYEASIR